MNKTVLMKLTSISMVNGEFTDSLSVNDRGLAFGDGVFETMRLENNQFPFLQFHLQRLSMGCESLGISLDLQKLQHSLVLFQSHLAGSGCDFGVVKMIVTRGAGGRGVVPLCEDQQTSSQIFFFRHDANKYSGWLREPIELILSDYVLPCNPSLAGIKHLNRLDYVLAASRHALNEDQQLVLTNADRNVVETLHHNIFCLLSDELVTPLLDTAGVNGVVRRLIVEQIAPQLGLNVTVRSLSVDELRQADEIFITNAVMGVVPVRKLDDRNLSSHSMSKKIGDSLQKAAIQKRVSSYAS